jgi:hypothetical protein
MRPQDLGDLLADGDDRVEGGERLLRDQRDVSSAQAAHLALGESEQIALAEHDSTRRDVSGRRGQQPQDREGCDALA